MPADVVCIRKITEKSSFLCYSSLGIQIRERDQTVRQTNERDIRQTGKRESERSGRQTNKREIIEGESVPPYK